MPSINIIIGALVFLLIAFRHVIPIKLKYWHIMFLGAVSMLLLGGVTPRECLYAIDFDVLISLFGLFLLGYSVEESGYLAHLTYKYLKRANSFSELILLVIFIFGLTSALLMNDTIAIVGVTVISLLARNYGIDLKFLVLLLAFSITTGSVLSPIGNPQNLLIALQPVFTNPFVEFFKFLLLPTVLNLMVLYLYFGVIFKEKFHSRPLAHSQEPIKDKSLAHLSKISLFILLGLIFIKILEFFLPWRLNFKISHIPILSALPLLLFYRKGIKLLKGVDYDTLLFFIGIFIVTHGLTKDEMFLNFIKNSKFNPASNFAIIANSILLSQIISNVPLTIFYLKILGAHGATQLPYIILAFASTIAGNLTILGAASNVIILQRLERKAKEHILNFFEFMKFGVPLTLIQVLIFLLFIKIYSLIGWL